MRGVSMSERRNKRLLITLGSIIDDRFGTMALLDPKHIETLDFDTYSNRTNDKLSGANFTVEQYELAWSRRDVLTLMHGMPTQIWRVVGDRLSSFIAGEFAPATSGVVEIDVNIYPYVLTEEERADLEGVLFFYFSKAAKINLINVPIKNITFDFLRNDYHTMIIYEVLEWLKTMPPVDEQRPVPGCLVYGPALEDNPAKSIDELESLEPELREMYLHGGGFAELEYLYEPFVSLRLIEASNFSFTP